MFHFVHFWARSLVAIYRNEIRGNRKFANQEEDDRQTRMPLMKSLKSYIANLAIAAALSMSCAAGTYYWYLSTEPQQNRETLQRVAEVASVHHEVLRRAPKRLLWEGLNVGDALHDGETIRTAEDGEIKIRFDDGRSIDLEPESLIAIQKSQSAIQLELVEGSAFVSGQTRGTQVNPASQPSLLLKSAQQTVQLNGASVALSKSSSDHLNIQVLEGRAQIEGAGGSRELKSGEYSDLDSQSSVFHVQIISPVLRGPVYLHSGKKNLIEFKWSGLPAQYKTEIWAGPSRSKLRLVGVSSQENVGQVLAQIPYGRISWKLVARQPETGVVKFESPLYRLDLRAHPPAILNEPQNNAMVLVDAAPANLNFQWKRPVDAERVEVTLSKQPDFSSNVFQKKFTKEESFRTPPLDEGFYFVRTAAYYRDFVEPEYSPLQRFTLRNRDSMHQAMAPIKWTIPGEKTVQEFGLEPRLELAWKPQGREDEISSYRLQLFDPKKVEQKPIILNLRQRNAVTPVPNSGRYIASVEAIDKYDHVVGQSEQLELDVRLAPLLNPPTILPAEGPLRAGGDGKTEIRWQPMKGATEYEMVIRNKQGRELFKATLKQPVARMKNFMPGEYDVELVAFDHWGRKGQQGVPRVLVVPDNSGLQAPKLKRIKVD
jgi:FecR protein